ncbi:MAG: glutamate--cysteine ligase [Gammaproteobacteria bacterium]
MGSAIVMGLEIKSTEFTEADFSRFSSRLRENLKALETLLKRPGFGEGDLSFGAELELYIIDRDCKPLHINQEIIAKLNDPQLTLELNRYNLEYNFSPVLLKDNCFATTQQEALAAVEKINACAAHWQGSVVPVGILPTLQQSDIGYHAMTQLARYEALTKELTQLRGGPFTIAIEGEDTLQLAVDDVTLEGANTSFQAHLRVPPQEYASFYNAVQLVTPLVVAIAANSPTLFGHRLWQETRVPLFKQSIDCRPKDTLHPIPARVNFGNNWIRDGAFELFAEAALLYRPLLPVCDTEDPMEVVKGGGTPGLHELRLHQGTIWLWNRPVFDPIDGGHLRIELRAFPAGPSIVDMLANAALAIGLAKLMQPSIPQLLPAIPFTYCTANFYRAAQKGLDAEIFWPSVTQSEPEYSKVSDILLELLPRIPEQLASMGFIEADFMPLLDVIGERLASGQTGAQWQLHKLAKLRNDMHKRDALQEMLSQYQKNSLQNIPVARWQ